MLRPILYMVLSAFFFSVLNSLIRYVDHMPTFQLVFFRSIGSAICGIAYLTYSKIPMFGTHKKLLILRAFFGISSMALYYKALQLMPMGTAVSLRYLSPFFAAGFAVWLLKEKMKPIQWVFFVTAFIGVAMLKGFDHRITLFGFLVIMTCSMISGLVYVTIRKIGNSEHPIVIVNYFMTLAALVGGILSIFNWTQPMGIEWLIIISMGIVGFIAQVFMTLALQGAEANLITPFKYAEVIFTLIAGWLIFNEYQTLFTIFAMAVIILSLLANVWVKQRKTKSIL